MGGCVSFPSSSGVAVADKPYAHVVLSNGDLRQFSVPVTVSEVLQSEASSSSSFVCNSDRLYYDEYIPAMKAEDELQAGQIYFVLPKSKLQYKLSASDMAALAVKASIAMEKTSGGGSSSRGRKKKKKARISPVLLDAQEQQQNNLDAIDGYNYYQISKDGVVWPNRPGSSNHKASGLGVSRSGSVRKLQRYSSKRAKMAVRSFRLRLSTIYEGSVLQISN